ncbi:MAG: glycosyltransferase [Bacteroidales bacterium]|nr:glycosyltransferase [Bacteroidales bacterium]
MKIGLCLLTLNEFDGCKHDIPKIKFNKFDEIFAVDGGSNDGTVEYLEQNNIKVYKQEKAGYNQAYIESFKHCHTDALIFFHPKGSINPEEALKFRKYFENGYELIIASRMLNKSVNEEDKKIIKYRKWFVLGLSRIASILWRKKVKRIKDVLHGFRGITKNAFYKIDPLPCGLSLDIEMVIRGYKKNIKMIEFPVEENNRVAGDTHFKAIPTGKKLLKYMWFELFRKEKKINVFQ